MPSDIVAALILVFGLFGIVFMFQSEARLFAAVSMLISGALLQWIVIASEFQGKTQDKLIATLTVFEIKEAGKTVHVAYHSDNIIVLEKEMSQEIKSKEIQVFEKPSNFVCGIYFSSKTKYVQK